MVENSPGLQRKPVNRKSVDGIEILNAVIFPLQHLQDCLGQIKNGTVFEGVPLDNFRSSNRTCRNINIAVSAFSTFLGSGMLRSKTNGFRGKLLKAGGLLILARAAHQAIGAYDKSQRQLVLDSALMISREDFP